MGLLDDAIREHLELKRLRGADPGDVAREEREALGPLDHEDGVEAHDSDIDEGRRWTAAVPAEDGGWAARPPGEPAVRETSASDDPGPIGGETVELDMESVLASDADAIQDPGDASDTAPGQDRGSGQRPGESLEWEVPHERNPQIKGQQLEPEPNMAEDETVEDVLEETPDFLRDTPEQERLWFEQRPPRDFDFNE